MKKLLTLISTAIFFASCTTKTGSGSIETQTRNHKNFKAVSASGSFEVKLKQGNTYKVLIEADDNIMDDIETEVNGDKLIIEFRDNLRLNNITAKVFVEAPEFTFIGGSASADIESENSLQSNKEINIKASSAAAINLMVNAPAIEAEASSGGSILLTGKTKSIDLQASSGAHLNADELLAENAKVQASSGSEINLHASVNLNAKASSGASVKYRGNATVSQQASSGGSIVRMNN